MKKLFVSARHFKRPLISALVLVLLILTLTAWGSGGFGLAQASSNVANATNATTLTPQWTGFGPQACPKAVANPSHWNSIVGIHGGQKVESVSCGNLLNNPSLQALVTVRNPGSSRLLDVYVYNNITSAHPAQLFKLQGLNRGKAKISNYNTVVTAQVDLNSSINKGQPTARLTLDLFREFRGFDTAVNFVQVVFPGMFPDLTRWQAEADQQKVNNGQDSWKLDAVKTTSHALKFLNRSANNLLTLLSGGGSRDLTATVRAEALPQGGVAATIVTLSRLEGNANGGIWEITAVQADKFGITSPQSGLSTTITSPVTVKGFGLQFEGEVGNVVILDHLYAEIGREIARGTGGFTESTFSIDVPYTSSFHAGAQEGIVELIQNSGGGNPVVVMVKVLVKP